MTCELGPVQFFWGGPASGEVIANLLKIKQQAKPPLEKLVWGFGV